MSEPAEQDAKDDKPLQWCRATLVGDYYGVVNAKAPKATGRRYQLEIYRAQLDALTLLDAAPADAPNDVELWQAQIAEARIAHLLGPGTLYEGPVFEVQLRQVRLACPIEHRGRAYGKIEAQATFALVMPDKPPIPKVKVQLRGVQPSRATESAPRASSELPRLARASDFMQSTSIASKPLAATVSLGGPQDEARPGAVMGGELRQERSLSLGWLALGIAAIGIGLFVQSGWIYAFFWGLFALPSLLFRWMFGELLRPSRFTRVSTALACLIPIACAALSVHAFRQCAPFSYWPGIVALWLLFPACLLPSALPPFSCMASLALIVGLFSRYPQHCPQPESEPVRQEHTDI